MTVDNELITVIAQRVSQFKTESNPTALLNARLEVEATLKRARTLEGKEMSEAEIRAIIDELNATFSATLATYQNALRPFDYDLLMQGRQALIDARAAEQESEQTE